MTKIDALYEAAQRQKAAYEAHCADPSDETKVHALDEATQTYFDLADEETVMALVEAYRAAKRYRARYGPLAAPGEETTVGVDMDAAIEKAEAL